jgi:hypothetical protein
MRLSGHGGADSVRLLNDPQLTIRQIHRIIFQQKYLKPRWRPLASANLWGEEQ